MQLPSCLKFVGMYTPTDGPFAGQRMPLYEADDVRTTLLYQQPTSQAFRDALRRASQEDLQYCIQRAPYTRHEPGRLYALRHAGARPTRFKEDAYEIDGAVY